MAAFVLRPIPSSRYPWRNQRKSNTYFEENTVQFPTPLNTPSTGDCYLRDSYESCDHSPATIKIAPYKFNEMLNLGDKFTAISDPSTVSLYHSSYGYVDMFANRTNPAFPRISAMEIPLGDSIVDILYMKGTPFLKVASHGPGSCGSAPKGTLR